MSMNLGIADIEPAVLSRLRGKSLLLTKDWSKKELNALLAVAKAFERLDRAGRSTRIVQDELGYAMFFDQSTRTKSAWSGATTRLGMTPVIVDGSSTQVSHGETAAETGAMIGMNAHAIGVRHDLVVGQGNTFMRDVKQGIDDYLAATKDKRSVPIVNLQCDIDHPTQTLADLQWLREYFKGGIAGKKIAVTWAYSPSYAKPLSVSQGLATLLTRFGAHVSLAHPEGYRLMDSCMETAKKHAEASGGSFEIVDSMDEAFRDADVVYPKSWGPYDLMLERVKASDAGDRAGLAEIEARALERNAKFSDWICDERRMALTSKGNALYMHCLPANIGQEVTPGVMEKHRVHVAREANKKIYVIMALLAVSKAKRLKKHLSMRAK